MQGHSDDEDDFPLPQPAAPEVIPVPAIQQVQPEEEPAVENLMNISAVAYSGCPSDSTISLLLHFPYSTAVALADTGSTNTFMDYQFALKHNIPLTQTRKRSVKVAVVAFSLLNSWLIIVPFLFKATNSRWISEF
jgi:hypothetical protein